MRALEIRRARLAPNDPVLAENLRLARCLSLAARGVRPRQADLPGGVGCVADRTGPQAPDRDRDPQRLRGPACRAERVCRGREAAAGGDRRRPPGARRRNVDRGESLNNLGVTLSVLGRHSEAERLFRDAYETHRVLVGERHWRTANVARNVGRSLALQQRYREAVAWMDRAIEALSSVDPADPPNGPAGLFGMRAQRAHMLFRLNQRQDGIAQAAAAVSDLERLAPANAARALAFSRVILGRMLNEIGRPRDGEPILAQALGGVESLGPNIRSTPKRCAS